MSAIKTDITLEVDPHHDPLAVASETPNVAALIREFEYASLNGVTNINAIAAAEDVQYNRRPGKSNPPDGCLWQRNLKAGDIARPYDGRPDTDIPLADELVLAEVDMDMTAFANAQLGATTSNVSALTAAQVAELRAVAQWCKRALEHDFADNLELLFQMKAKLGWSVLNPGWLERWELVERQLDMETIVNQSRQLPPGTLGHALPELILDPALEDSAVEIARQMFGHLDNAEAKRIVRELREQGHTEFLDRQLAEKRPTVRTLIQGFNYFVSGAQNNLHKARGHLVIERFFQADLLALASARGWNPGFVQNAIGTAGQYSKYGEAMRLKSLIERQDSQDKSIEIWTSFCVQFDEATQAAGVYVTVFSPHLRPATGDEGSPDYFGEHYLCDFAHGRVPFVQVRRQVEGPSLDDSRGVCEMVRADQNVLKKLEDALVVRAHMEVDPPRAFIGAGWSRADGGIKPGAALTTVMPGADIKDLSPSRGNPGVCEQTIARIDARTRRRFALPNNTDGSHPMSWQMRQMRATKRTLGALAETFTQLMVLCYQNFDEYELAEIIGRWPQLTLQDVLKHRITLTFDARGLDTDWTQTVLDFMIKLLGIDRGGMMDVGPILQIALAYIDPTVGDRILRSPEGASAAIYKQVEQAVTSLMAGNPPQLAENDATAGMQLQMAMAVIGKNPDFQRVLMQNQRVQENFKVYIQNLQHNVQETQISPQQGKLGVAAQPQQPVRSGPMTLPAAGQ
jgi:hypothetical protein